jgi:hypothetical protein
MNPRVTDQPYNTAINILGGLKTVAELLVSDTYALGLDESGIAAGLRTEATRGRVERSLQTVLLNFRSERHAELVRAVFSSHAPSTDLERILFWHLALTNRLFRELSTQVFAPAYFDGRAGIKKDDLVGYMKDCVVGREDNKLKWTATTIATLATKYLNLMTKLNLLTGVRNKSFLSVRLTGEALTLFLYFAHLHQPEGRNIFNNELLPLCFVPRDDLVGRLKKLCLNETFAVEFNGLALNIDPTVNFAELPHVLYR